MRGIRCASRSYNDSTTLTAVDGKIISKRTQVTIRDTWSVVCRIHNTLQHMETCFFAYDIPWTPWHTLRVWGQRRNCLPL